MTRLLHANCFRPRVRDVLLHLRPSNSMDPGKRTTQGMSCSKSAYGRCLSRTHGQGSSAPNEAVKLTSQTIAPNWMISQCWGSSLAAAYLSSCVYKDSLSCSVLDLNVFPVPDTPHTQWATPTVPTSPKNPGPPNPRMFSALAMPMAVTYTQATLVQHRLSSYLPHAPFSDLLGSQKA